MTDLMLKEALDLRRKRLAVHWLHPQSKKPISKGWSNASVLSEEQLKTKYRPGNNLGVRTGKYSQPEEGKALIIVDMDVKSTDPDHTFEAYDAVEELLGNLSDYPCVASGRGNGSMHVYALVEQDRLPKNKKFKTSRDKVKVEISGEMVDRPAWEVEILSTNKQAVLPPSIHPDTGEQYSWIKPIDGPIPTVPEQFYEALNQEGSSREDRVQQATLNASSSLTGFEDDIDLDALGIPRKTQERIIHGLGDKDSRSEEIMTVILSLLLCCISPPMIERILTDPQYAISEKALQERRGDITSAREWVRPQIEKALNDLVTKGEIRITANGEVIKTSTNELYNERYGVASVAGKTVIVQQRQNLESGFIEDVFSSVGDTSNLLANKYAYDDKGRPVMVGDSDKHMKAWDHWFSWRQRNTYRDVYFKPIPGTYQDPSCKMPQSGSYNRWKGLALRPQPGCPC